MGLFYRIEKRIHEASKLLKLQVAKEKYYVLFLISISCAPSACLNVPRKMGVNIEMESPAVCYTCDGIIKLIGNGREMKYHMRKLSRSFIKLIKKIWKKIKRYNHKLKKYKEHKDYEISKKIIVHALQENINIICLEKLTYLQHKFTNHTQMCWSYERLQIFISYKAKLAGMQVVYVKPDLTSKRCPKCNRINNVKNRHYLCRCGFHHHRDVVAL